MKGLSLKPVKVDAGQAPSDASADSSDIQDTGSFDLDNLPAAQPTRNQFNQNIQDPAQLESDDLNALPDVGGTLGKVYGNVSQVDPSRAAKILDVSQKLNQPPAFVDKNLDAAKKAADGPSPNFFEDIEARYPGTTKFLSDPKNMAVTHDDIPNVAQHEDLVNEITEARSISDDLLAGSQASVSGMIARRSMPSMRLSKNADWIDRGLFGAAQLAGDAPFMGAGAAIGAEGGATVGGTVGGLTMGLPGLALGGFVGGIVGGGYGAFAAPAALREQLRGAYEKGDTQSLAQIMETQGSALKEGNRQGLVGALTSTVGLGVGALPVRTGVKAVLAPAAEVGAMTVGQQEASGGDLKDIKGSDILDAALQVGVFHGLSEGNR